jgi:hypothetical protein
MASDPTKQIYDKRQGNYGASLRRSSAGFVCNEQRELSRWMQGTFASLHLRRVAIGLAVGAVAVAGRCQSREGIQNHRPESREPCCGWGEPCWMGCSKAGSTRAKRASSASSRRSPLRSLRAMAWTLRGWAPITQAQTRRDSGYAKGCACLPLARRGSGCGRSDQGRGPRVEVGMTRGKLTMTYFIGRSHILSRKERILYSAPLILLDASIPSA